LGKTVPAERHDKQPAAHDDPEHQQRSTVIGARILRILGQPGELHRVQVRFLWEDHYRVNVFGGADAATAKVAHSYFLPADGGGNIVASSPPITRQYGSPAGATSAG
jgi:hypothetical protein